eukprot:11749195-Ditylum_brightwellii.AAC.1
MPATKHSKALTSINTSGLCQTKENGLKCIANWLSLMNHNYVINNATHPYLFGAFLKLADLIAEKDYKNGMAAPFGMCHGFQCSTLISCSRSCQ